MSQENVEMVRRIHEALNRGGIEAIFRSMSPEFVWDASATGIPGLGVYRGADEVRAFFEEDWFKAFPYGEWEVQADAVINHRDQVIVKARQRGRGASSGVAAELEFVGISTLRGGEVARTEFYLDREQALEARSIAADRTRR